MSGNANVQLASSCILNNLIEKSVIAHHPYEASREDEISFEKDEMIKVTDSSDSDWWVGTKKDGSSGYFPSNVISDIG